MAVTEPVVELVNERGTARCLLVCDHASPRIPAEMMRRGFTLPDLDAHFLWDPGARDLALALSRRMDAPLVCSTVSRLVIDCNRNPEAGDLIPSACAGIAIPANRDLSRKEVAFRIAAYHEPYHAAIDAAMAARSGSCLAIVAVHSFTPGMEGAARPWHIGVLFDRDRRIADPLLAGLRRDHQITVGENQPYSPADGVYYTLGRHAQDRGLGSVMLELRNDVIETERQGGEWADRLALLLDTALADLAAGESVGLSKRTG